jgi:hypothetical protein
MRPRGNPVVQLPEAARTTLLEDRRSGMSQDAIASKYGITQSAVSRYLRSLGHPQVKRRRQSDNPRRESPDGYVLVSIDMNSPYASMANSHGAVLEHRLVMAQSLGRPLRPDETVHHIDGDRSHNHLANLVLWSGPHGAGVRLRCRRCGSTNIEVY